MSFDARNLRAPGNQIHVNPEEVQSAIAIVKRLGDRLYAGMFPSRLAIGEPNVDQ